MNGDQRTTLSSYASRLLSEGRIVFSANEAAQALGVNRGAFLDAAERLQRRQSLIKPRRGFYVCGAASVCILGSAATRLVH